MPARMGWQKASFSVGQGACVHLIRLDGDEVGVRNTVSPNIVLTGTVAEVLGLIDQLRGQKPGSKGFEIESTDDGGTVVYRTARPDVRIPYTKREVAVFLEAEAAGEFRKLLS
jgi:Domain of unknown function (DUF397)